VDDADYVPYVTAAMVDHAHDYGIEVVPWAVNGEATMRKLIVDGVDGIVTDRPDVCAGSCATTASSCRSGTASGRRLRRVRRCAPGPSLRPGTSALLG
jgi:hypothetical protein